SEPIGIWNLATCPLDRRSFGDLSGVVGAAEFVVLTPVVIVAAQDALVVPRFPAFVGVDRILLGEVYVDYLDVCGRQPVPIGALDYGSISPIDRKTGDGQLHLNTVMICFSYISSFFSKAMQLSWHIGLHVGPIHLMQNPR